MVSLAAAAGPAVYRASDGFTARALQARADAAVLVSSRTDLVLALRRIWLRGVYGAPYEVTAVTLGFRLRSAAAR